MNEPLQPDLPGFEPYPDMPHNIMPDFNQLLTKKVEAIKGGFDPHQLMVKKKLIDAGESQDLTPKREWPEKDIKTLEDFCNKMGIVEYNCGKMSPIAALAMLKQQLGVVEGPLEERVPLGYQKLGSKFNSNYSYTQMVKEKTEQKGLLHG
jgi:hypothetical protein